MSKQAGIYWLASYPKSGNTWFRIFLANLLHLSGLVTSDGSVIPSNALDLNQVDNLINDEIATSRAWVNRIAGFNTAWLTDDEVDALLPTLYAWYGEQQTQISYHKSHRAYTYVGNHQALIPQKGCRGCIYFVRNPLDVAISLAHHFNGTIDEAIKIMGDNAFALHNFPLRQILLSWSSHVRSWTDAKEISHLFLRYEDMISKPLETFTKAIQFLQLEVNENYIKQAISHSSFHKLKKYEIENDYLDKPPKLKNFFRKGIAGDWQTTLTKNQIIQIIKDHAELMYQFGYLNSQAEPLIG